MDELLILLPIRIHFPFQSIDLKTLDHFMGTHFLCNYVTFDFLPSLKLPVSHVTEGRPDKLREKNLQADCASLCNGELVISADVQASLSICAHSPTSNRKGERMYG